MDWLTTHLGQVQIVISGLTAIWLVLARADKVLVKHLSDTFATRTDFARLERKVDSLLPARSKLVAVRKKAENESNSERAVD